MTRVCFLALLLAASAVAVFCQGASDYHKVEVYGGYSLGWLDSNLNSASFTSSGGTQTFTNLCSTATGEMIGPNFQRFFCGRRKFNGLDASITYNVTRYVGLKGDFTGHFKSETFIDKFTPPGVTQTVSNKERLYNFLAGVQVKNNSKSARLKPFAHALAGWARYANTQQQTLDLFPQFNFTIEDRVTSFAMKLGGGLDARAGRRVDVRVVEFDYNPVFTGNRDPKSVAGPFTRVAFTGQAAHNFTLGFGIVIH